MSEQLIISVSREFGSGGHVIAEKLAEKFGLPLYDKNLISEIANERNLDAARLEKYDEKPKNQVFSRRVRGFSNSNQENIANMQFDFLRNKADKGESFVIVGRCAETILKPYEGLIPLFVLADMECKIARIMDIEGLSRADAINLIERQNRRRKDYHNYYCEKKWGDSRNYDLTINSSRLGIDRTADFLENYILQKRKG